MKIESFLIGVIVFSFFMVGGVLIISDINANYGKTISTSEFTNTYNSIDSVYNISTGMSDKIFEADIEEDSAEDSMFRGTFSGLRLVKESFSLIGNIINDIAITLSLPVFIVKFAMAAIGIMVIFGIIYLVRGISQ